MKKVLLAGFISSTLVLSSFAAAFADDTQSTTAQTSGTTTVTAPAAAGSETTTTSATTVLPATTASPTVTPAQTDTSKAGLLKQLKDAIDKALVKDVDPQVVSALRAKNYSYSKIALVAGLAKASGKTVDEVSTILDQHKGLGEIAQLLGIKVKDLKSVRKEISQSVISGLKDFRSTIKQDEQSIMDKIASLKGEVKKDKEDRKDVKDQAKKDAEAAVVKGMDPVVVDSLRAKGYGFGQIALINALSKKSSKSIDEVVAAITQNKGMEAAAQALGLQPEDLQGIKKDFKNEKKEAVSQDKEKINEVNTQLKSDQEDLKDNQKVLKNVEKQKKAVNKFEKRHGKHKQKGHMGQQDNEQD